MNDILTGIIIDDDEFARDTLEDYLLEFNNIQILKKVGDSKIAVKHVMQYQPDMVFLDINMPNKSGLDIIREIKQLQIQTNVIFITAHDSFVVDALRDGAMDYLLKPICKEELRHAVQRVHEKQTKETKYKEEKKDKEDDRTKIVFRNAHGSLFYKPKDIIYFEADGCYTKIHTTQQRVEMVARNIGQIEPELPDNYFFRISRSAIINMGYLNKIDRVKKSVSLHGNKEIIIKASRERLFNLEVKVSELNNLW